MLRDVPQRVRAAIDYPICRPVAGATINMSTTDDVIERVRAEFLEMPGLRLTAPQVQRLCAMEAMACEVALRFLVNAKFLRVKPDGHYVRLTDGTDVPHRHGTPQS